MEGDPSAHAGASGGHGRPVRDPHSPRQESTWRRVLNRAFGDRNSRQFTLVSTVVTALVLAVVFGVYQSVTDPDPSLQARAVVNQDAIVVDGQTLGATYVIPDVRANLDKPPAGAETSCAGRYEWATTQNGVVANVLTVRVTLTPRDSASTVIDGVSIEADARNRPLGGTVALCSGGGGSDPTDPSVLRVALTRASNPTVSFETSGGEPADFIFELPGTETATFDVNATTVDCDCSFHLVLTGTQDGNPFSINVKGPHGGAFRVTSTERSDPAAYDQTNGAWLLQGPTGTQPTQDFSDLKLDEVGPSACQIIDIRRVEKLADVNLVAGSGSTTFQPGDGPASDDHIGTAICSWTSGPAAANGNFPTLALQHMVAATPAAAQRTFDALISGMAANGEWSPDRIAGQDVEVQEGNGTAVMWTRGRFVLLLTGNQEVPSDLLRVATEVLIKAQQ